MYSQNDITIISNGSIENDELFEYVTSNAIDLVLELNTGSQLLFRENFKRIKPTQNLQKTLDNSNVKELTRRKIDFKFKASFCTFNYRCNL